MGINSLSRGIIPVFVLSLFLVVSFCYADETVKVVGFGECADCKENNIHTSQAFSELRVTIDCKLKNGEMQRRGVGDLDKDGKFEVSLPKEIVKEDGGLKEECYAQLHSASAAPCPSHNGIEASKIVAKQQGFEPAEKVKFSSSLCASDFLLFHKKPCFKKPLPFYKPKPKFFPHEPIYKPKPKPFYKPIPIYKPKPKPIFFKHPFKKPCPPPFH